MSLLSNLNHQIYWSDLPVLTTVRTFYCSKIPVFLMPEKKSTSPKKGWLKFVTMIVQVNFTDKRTDVWSRNFLIWEINFGLWAVAWARPWEKGVWADSEQLFWVFFSIFHGQKKKKKN